MLCHALEIECLDPVDHLEYYTPNNPDFDDCIRALLYNEDFANTDSDSSVVDDSDEDLDFVIQNAKVVNHTNQVSTVDSSSEEDDGDDNFLLEARRIEQDASGVSQGHDTEQPEEFYLERMKKSEPSPPNAWSSKEPKRNVRTPATNIIRILPGIKGRTRTLGNQPTKIDVWKLLFDDTMVHTIVNQQDNQQNTKRESGIIKSN